MQPTSLHEVKEENLDVKQMPRSPDFCSPLGKVTSQVKASSCMSYDTLLMLARLYNNHASDADQIAIPKRRSAKVLWSALDRKLKNTCGDRNEACWIEQPFVKHSSQYNNITKLYRPLKPQEWYKEERKWLNTYDILSVMKQYEDADSSFKFLGVFPCDFALVKTHCVVKEICDLHLRDLWKRKIKKVGVVFNTDSSKGSGQHWIAIFIGLNPVARNYGVFFYDSVANAPQKEFKEFIDYAESDLKNLHPKHTPDVKRNRIQKQMKNYDCGVYAMLFIIRMLTHKFDKVCESMGHDDEVAKFRNILYRPSNFRTT